MARANRWRSCTIALLTGFALLLTVESPTARAAPVWPKLTPRLQSLLQQEMTSVIAATHRIVDALVRGDAATVADEAAAIEQSFIMKQSMTAADREALNAALPAAFVALDKQFHETAAALVDAARAEDWTRMQARFHEMLSACTACHARFATDRLPAFAGGNEQD